MSHGANEAPGWQQRRAELLPAACGEVACRIEAGEPVTKALRRVARQYHGRSLRAAGRRLKCRYKTLVEKWYAWRGSRTRAVFQLRYKPGRPRIDRAPLLRMAKHCARHGLTAREGFDLLQSRGARFCLRSFLRAVPAARLSRVASLRRKLETERAQALAALVTP